MPKTQIFKPKLYTPCPELNHISGVRRLADGTGGSRMCSLNNVSLCFLTNVSCFSLICLADDTGDQLEALDCVLSLMCLLCSLTNVSC